MATPLSPAGNTGPTTPTPRRGRKPGTQTRQRATIPADEFNGIEDVDEDERVEFKRRREDRDQQQQDIDALVAETYKDWVEAGRPTNWADIPSKKWTLSKRYVEDAMFKIRKAGNLHGRKIIFGSPKYWDKDGKLLRGEKAEAMAVKVTISYCAIARAPRKPKDEKN